jgi:uncharacterized protein
MISNAALKQILLLQRKDFLAEDLGVERTQLEAIEKTIPSPFAIVVSGLRRVGKSTFLAQIAHRYYGNEDFFYTHFEDERLLHFTVEDFERLLVAQIELFGDKKCFFLDEIQNIKGWEVFVRRIIDQGYKVYVSGSNASLLSREFGTRLTGRYLPFNLYPFSFKEFLNYKKIALKMFKGVIDAVMEAQLKRALTEYIQTGGIPEALKYPEQTVHDILYRDVIARYGVESIKQLKELAAYLLSNIAQPFAYSKLKQAVMLGSITTAKNFVEYFENSWLFFTVNQYALSVKKQQIAPKKIYSIDSGLVQSLAFQSSENRGRFFENIAFLELHKKHGELFYYLTKEGLEVDFLDRRKGLLFQVCSDLSSSETRDREILALEQAMEELGWSKGFILTESEEEEIQVEHGTISVLPLQSWLL